MEDKKYDNGLICLCVETSEHVKKHIDLINNAIKELIEDLKKEVFDLRVEIITFNQKAEVVREFQNVKEIDVPTFTANGDCLMANALALSFNTIKKEFNELPALETGATIYKPILFLITSNNHIDKTYSKKVLEHIEHYRNRISIKNVLVGDAIKNNNLKHSIELTSNTKLSECFSWTSIGYPCDLIDYEEKSGEKVDSGNEVEWLDIDCI